MNQLNSILLEGTLLDEPSMIYTKSGVAETFFRIRSIRSYKKGEEEFEDILIVGIVTRGRRAEVCKEDLGKGCGVRVVGRLAPTKDEQIGIFAEHVEFKPKLAMKVGS